ncbi:MAG: PhnD/SsuA/transferrin family substrate-binding protein [Duodenibacillus sp.]|nr:PhnD/SsuA/transferrin family substrate-binding protein [Duodenibacillus sp.]
MTTFQQAARKAALILAAAALAALPAAVQADDPLDAETALMNAGVSPDGMLPGRAADPLLSSLRARVSAEQDGPDAPVRYVFNSPMRIGVQQHALLQDGQDFVSDTISRLKGTLGEFNVEVHYLNRVQIARLLRRGVLDFVIVDAGFYASRDRQASLKALASYMPWFSENVNEAVGSVYIARDDELVVQSPADLIGQPVAVYDKRSFESFMVAQWDLRYRGLSPEVTLSKAYSLDFNVSQVLQEVINGKAVAGILPACAIELLHSGATPSDLGLKVIGQRDGGLTGCARSTELFPSAYFAVDERTDPKLARIVGDVLFDMNSRWVRPATTRFVHDLMFDLRIGPYEHLAAWSADRFVRQQSTVGLVTLAILCLIIAYTLTVSVMVRRRTSQLRIALAERNRIERLARASRNYISKLERTGIVGQMSTMIAHELKQPLGAINNFANGLLRRARRGALDETVLAEVLADIVEQSTRASEIVNRVRAYAKRQTPALKLEDMHAAIEHALDTFRRSRRTDAVIHQSVPYFLWADIDAWEIELAVLNLLKNAADALEGVLAPEIWVAVRVEDIFWRVEVKDNGARITQEQVNAFMEPLTTSKKGGLGLGLSIVASIAERHHGRLVGIANPDRGVTIAMDIPRAALPENTAI